MGFLRRDKGGGGGAAGSGDLVEVLLEGTDLIEQVGQAHRARWGLGSADSWTVTAGGQTETLTIAAGD